MDRPADAMDRGLALVQGILHDVAGMLFDPSQRTFWGFLLSSVVLAWLVRHVDGERPVRTPGSVLHRSAWLDVKLIVVNAILRSAGVLGFAVTAFGLAAAIVTGLDGWLGAPRSLGIPASVVVVVYTVVLFVVWDASRYLLHRWMHDVPWLWELHKVHHSAEVLTPLTLYRVHPIEILLAGVRDVVVTGVVMGGFFYVFRRDAVELELLGINVIGFVFSLVGANLRHSHVWWPWGRLERWLMSPAQHQLHHAVDATRSVNLGTALSVWDRLAGTLEIAGEQPPRGFGLPPEQGNHHPHHLGSALWSPMIAALGRLVPGRRRALVSSVVGCIGASAPTEARAEPPAPTPQVEATPPVKPRAATPVPLRIPEPKRAPTKSEQAPETRTVIVGSMLDGAELPRIAGSAHVVGRRELERNEYDDMHRVLSSVPGVYVRGEDGFGLRPNIGLRGANPDRSSKVTLMEDGILLAPAPYSAPAAYYFPLPTRMVGIEVFKGPATIKYGPNTIGGAINLLTRGIPDTHEAVFDVAGGRYGYAKGHAYWGMTRKGFGVLLEAAHLQSQGFKKLDNGGDTGFRKNEAMAKLSYEVREGPDGRHRIELKGGYSNELSNETYLGLARSDFDDSPYRRYAASQRDRMKWHRSQVEATYLVGGGAVELETRAYRHDFTRVWRRLDRFRDGPALSDVLANPDAGQLAVLAAIIRGDEDTTTPDQALMVTNNDRKFVSQGVQSVFRWRPKWHMVEQDLELGARFHNDSISRHHTEYGYSMLSGTMVRDGTDPVLVTSNFGQTNAMAFHAHESLTVADRVTIATGLRVEAISMHYRDRLTGVDAARIDPGVSPGIGALVLALPWLGVFAGVHRGFSPVAPGQPTSVKAEHAVNYEAGIRATRPGLQAEAVGFFSDYSNLNGICTFSAGCSDGDGTQQFNAGRVWVYGLESLVRYRHRFEHGFGLEVGGTYTFTGSQFRHAFESSFGQWGDVAAGDSLPYVPQHLFGGSIAVGGRIWDVSVRPGYTGAMRDVAGQGPIPKSEKIDGFFVIDASAEVRVLERVQIYAQGGNLTGNAYVTSFRPFGLRPGAPLTFMFGLKVRVFP